MRTMRPAALLLLLAALGSLAVPCCCGVRRQIRDSQDSLLVGPENVIRPNRPKVFTSPEELRGYLEALSNYYAIASRPRFGKRVPSSSSMSQQPPMMYDVSRHLQPSDVFEFLEPPTQMLDD